MNEAPFDQGTTRRAVLGDEYVHKSMTTADAFNMPMQDLTAEYCGAWCWGREGLPLKTRSMLNLAMIVVLNRPHELKAHVRDALTSGVTKEEITEILLRATNCGGVPGGIHAFCDAAKEAITEYEAANA